MCTFMLQIGAFIVGYDTGALWDLYNISIEQHAWYWPHNLFIFELSTLKHMGKYHMNPWTVMISTEQK